jgi:transcriptional regulator with XRE-family HTH domain
MRSKLLSNFLKNKRAELGVSQADVAKYLGHESAQFISNIERGVASVPIPTLKKLGDFYNIPQTELYDILLSSYVASAAERARKDWEQKEEP